MSTRKCVRDYAGNELYAGDLVSYPTRQGNRVRSSDAIILRTYVERFKGRLIPMLEVRPTGTDSGIVPRTTLAIQHISTEHARLVEPGLREGI